MRAIAGFGIVVWIVLFVVGAYGWGCNIVALVGMNADPITGLFILRIVGIFLVPIGVVVGLFF